MSDSLEKNAGKNLLLLGPPGAGKGTQAQFLAQKFNLQKIDTGNLIRGAIKAGTALGIEAKEYVEAGKLIPDNLVIGLILSELKQITDANKNFLLDGFPRNLAQAEALDKALLESNLSLDKVIEITLDSNKLLERITGRRICTNKACGAVYHLEFHPPQKENICDLCGSDLYQRDDDKAELVKSRLETYQRETLPLTEFYLQKGNLIKIDGNNSQEQVSLAIENIM
jgi:adenylate kinase